MTPADFVDLIAGMSYTTDGPDSIETINRLIGQARTIRRAERKRQDRANRAAARQLENPSTAQPRAERAG